MSDHLSSIVTRMYYPNVLSCVVIDGTTTVTWMDLKT